MKGLTIRELWIDLILDGQKTWELRTSATANRGKIALVRKGSGLIEGVATLVDVLPPLDRRGLAESFELHRIPPEEQENAIANDWLTPWVFVDPLRFAAPVAYRHPNGAVRFFDLAEEVRAGVERARRRHAAERSGALPEPAPVAHGGEATAMQPPDDTRTRRSSKDRNPIKIDPALERLLVDLAEKRGLFVEPLSDPNTKLIRIHRARTGDSPIVFVHRTQPSRPAFKFLLEPRLDAAVAERVGRVTGVTRAINRNRGDHVFSHSGFGKKTADGEALRVGSPARWRGSRPSSAARHRRRRVTLFTPTPPPPRTATGSPARRRSARST
ncbi:ASCH domain-containing protein [Salinarimonas rosea]|uniref:ASCH domain-containing protein n=1 Tax=Salinarimonas rosea TaxID=552063 RepID=UPI0012EBA970|nr:ASCH domain-containing protein [Salinarimonas rosea]